MTYRNILAAGILAVGLLVQPGLAQSSDQPLTRPSPAARHPDQISLYIQAIEQAPDPSAAITAYARASALDPSNRQSLEAYVERMIDFDLPETAFHQAQVLVDMDPTNGKAWAVLSYVSARRGQMPEAFTDLVQAVNLEPDDAFVQSTAGQLLAWYDKNQAGVPDSLKNSLEKIRRQLAGQKTYADAYTQALDQLKQRPTMQPSQQQPTVQQYGAQEYAAPSYDNTYAPSTGYADSGAYYSPYSSLYYPLYPDSIYYPGYYPFYYSPSLAYSNWWWPWGSFFGSNFFFGFNHGFHDFDDFHGHHGHFDHGHFGFNDFHGHHGIFDHGRFGHGRDFSGGHGFADRGHGAFDVGRNGFGATHDVGRFGATNLGRGAMTSDRLGLAAPGAGGRTFGRTDALGSRTFRSGAGTRTQMGTSQTDVSRSLAMRGMGSSGGVSRGTSDLANRGTNSRSFSTPSRGFSSPGMSTRSYSTPSRGFSSPGMSTRSYSTPSRGFGSPGMSTRSFSAPSRGFSGGGAPMRSFSGSPSRGFSSGGMRGFSGGGMRGGGFSGGGFHGGSSGGGFHGGGMGGGHGGGGHGGGGHR